jgi:uncharacterized cupin superfamily protein
MSTANVYTAKFSLDDEDPDGYRCGVSAVGALAGGRELNVKLYEIPGGQSLCPYHYEYVEEWLLVLDGTPWLRQPDGERELERGELVCFAAGPAGAHKLTNRTQRSARLLMLSSAREPAVAVYPDSDKIGVWPGTEADNVMLHRADGAAGYYDGED